MKKILVVLAIVIIVGYLGLSIKRDKEAVDFNNQFTEYTQETSDSYETSYETDLNLDKEIIHKAEMVEFNRECFNALGINLTDCFVRDYGDGEYVVSLGFDNPEYYGNCYVFKRTVESENYVWDFSVYDTNDIVFSYTIE